MNATPAHVAAFLPEAPAKLEQILLNARLDEMGDVDVVVGAPAGEPDSKVGRVYELGQHRLICGDATDPAVVAELMEWRDRIP